MSQSLKYGTVTEMNRARKIVSELEKLVTDRKIGQSHKNEHN